MKYFILLLALFCGSAFSQTLVYKEFSPGGDLAGTGSTWNSQMIAPGAVTLAKQANLAASSIQCNASSSPATPAACNPLAAANLMSAVLNVAVVDTVDTSIPSGLPKTIDGHIVQAGESVLLEAITGQIGNGIYIAQNSGAWTRATNFPAGYVISQNCNLAVFMRFGTVFSGHTFRLTTSGGTITIGTDVQGWLDSPLAAATATNAGPVKITDASGVISVTGTPSVVMTSTVTTNGDCASFSDAGSGLSGSLSDLGNLVSTGPCVVTDPNGHPLYNGNGTGPTVTGTGCSLTSGGQDNTGSIVAGGVDTCTLTFGGSFTSAPACTATGVGATVIPYLNALPTVSAAVFKTTAAGTFTYTCL